MALHGHYHVADTARHADGSLTVSMAGDGGSGNLGLLYLPARQAHAPDGAPAQISAPTFAFLAERGDAGQAA
jgi:hypothetical protein